MSENNSYINNIPTFYIFTIIYSIFGIVSGTYTLLITHSYQDMILFGTILMTIFLIIISRDKIKQIGCIGVYSAFLIYKLSYLETVFGNILALSMHVVTILVIIYVLSKVITIKRQDDYKDIDKGIINYIIYRQFQKIAMFNFIIVMMCCYFEGIPEIYVLNDLCSIEAAINRLVAETSFLFIFYFLSTPSFLISKNAKHNLFGADLYAGFLIPFEFLSINFMIIFSIGVMSLSSIIWTVVFLILLVVNSVYLRYKRNIRPMRMFLD